MLLTLGKGQGHTGMSALWGFKTQPPAPRSLLKSGAMVS